MRAASRIPASTVHPPRRNPVAVARSFVAPVVVAAAAAVAASCSSGDLPSSQPYAPAPAAAASPAVLHLEVVARYPHDTGAYTEGLVFDPEGRLFESTGLHGRSSVREVEVETGRIVRERRLDDTDYGEGLAVVGDRLIQLTWTQQLGRVWGLEDFRALGVVRYEGEGWGLANDEDRGRLVMSDGTSTLTFRDPVSFAATGSVTVRRAGVEVDDLNELEVVDGQVWANVWRSTELVRIDPGTGEVTASVDAAELVPPGLTDPEAVLNGIAHRPSDRPNRLVLTGKLWPTLYEVDLVG